MTLPWKGKTQYQVHVETLELAARIADKYACGLCGMDGKCAAEIRAQIPAPHPEPARLHPIASETSDDLTEDAKSAMHDRLKSFYQVESVDALVVAMERHIVKLQTAALRDGRPVFLRVREG